MESHSVVCFNTFNYFEMMLYTEFSKMCWWVLILPLVSLPHIRGTRIRETNE